MGDLGLFFFLMSLNRKLRNQYFWRLKKIKLQLMQNRESFQTLDILFYFVFRITVNCGITAVNLNWKAFLIMHAWSVLDYRIHEDRRHFLIRFLSLQQSIHPSIQPSIHPSNKHLPKPYCICAIARMEHRDEDTVPPFKMSQSTWGHSYTQLTVIDSNCSKCYKGVGKMKINV